MAKWTVVRADRRSEAVACHRDQREHAEQLQSESVRATDKQLPLFVSSEHAIQVREGKELHRRCHPNIIAFPNICFYEGKLLNGENVLGDKYSHPFYESDFFYVGVAGRS